ncbi:446_t:CDS:2, partial [Acaulospora morrowiae]
KTSSRQVGCLRKEELKGTSKRISNEEVDDDWFKFIAEYGKNSFLTLKEHKLHCTPPLEHDPKMKDDTGNVVVTRGHPRPSKLIHGGLEERNVFVPSKDTNTFARSQDFLMTLNFRNRQRSHPTTSLDISSLFTFTNCNTRDR